MPKPSKEQNELITRVRKAVRDAIGRRGPAIAGHAAIDVLFHEKAFERFKDSPLWLHGQGDGDVSADSVGAVVTKSFQRRWSTGSPEDNAFINELVLDILDELPPLDSAETRGWVKEIDAERLGELQVLATMVPRRPREVRRLIAPDEAFRAALGARLDLYQAPFAS